MWSVCWFCFGVVFLVGLGLCGGLVGFVWFCSRSNLTSVFNLFASEIKHIVRIKNSFTEWLRLEKTS